MQHSSRLEFAVRGGLALVMVLVGAFLVALGFGWYTPEAGQLRAPPWIAIGSGAVFAGAGLAVLFPKNATLGWVIAMLILACTGSAALWIGVFADAKDISGGIPLIPQAINTLIGRVVFTLSGILCLVVLVWGLRLGPKRQRED